MNQIEEIDIDSWVEQAPDKTNKEFREAVHTILSAIASDPKLQASMILKGGILLAIRYHSHRFTKDIDLSTAEKLADDDADKIIKTLDTSLARLSEILDYDLVCKVQSYTRNPPKMPTATFPSIKIKVGYAYKGTAKHKRLLAKQSPTAIAIDYSLNELTPNVDSLQLGHGEELLAYSLTDLIAEKYRSLLQQIDRNRHRRQDVFDLYLLLQKFDMLDDTEKHKIHASLIEKAASRGISPNSMSMDVSEIRSRAKKNYHTLEDEVEGILPDFESSYKSVRAFYLSLPWES